MVENGTVFTIIVGVFGDADWREVGNPTNCGNPAILEIEFTATS
jgi:hypothetical protein